MPINMEDIALIVGTLKGTTEGLKESTKHLRESIKDYTALVETDRKQISARLKNGDVQFAKLMTLVKVGYYWLIGLTTLTFASWGFPEIFTKISLLFAGIAH